MRYQRVRAQGEKCLDLVVMTRKSTSHIAHEDERRGFGLLKANFDYYRAFRSKNGWCLGAIENADPVAVFAELWQVISDPAD